MDKVIAPSPDTPFVALARTRKGRLFRKEILRDGILPHPEDPTIKLTITPEFRQKMAENFESSLCDIVQFPLVDDNNNHSEDPERNRGEVIGVENEGNSLYAVIDVRDEKTAQDIIDQKLLGGSAFFSVDYLDTKTGDKAGPALLHVAGTNRPYLTELEPYQELIAASADTDPKDVTLLAPAKETSEKMDLAELKKLLKDEHKIDLDDLQEKVEALEEEDELELDGDKVLAALSAAGVNIKLAAGQEEEITNDDVVAAIAELAENNVALSASVQKMEREKVKDEIVALSAAGLIEPSKIKDTKKLDELINLKLTAPSTFEAMLPTKPLIDLKENGADESEGDVEDIDGEIARLTAPDGPAKDYVKASAKES